MMNNPMGEIKRSLCDERGSVTIEAGLYFVVFFVLCALLVDFSAVFLNKSYLARVTYSLASVVRERSVFYGEKEELSQQDVSDLYELAGVLLEESRLAGSRISWWWRPPFFSPAAAKRKDTCLIPSPSPGVPGTAIADLA